MNTLFGATGFCDDVPVETMTCETCVHADKHGWWGPGHRGTHCRGCHRSWTSLREGHCVRCHEHFSTPANFDKHLGPHGCVPPGEVRSKSGAVLLEPRERAGGRVWVSPSAGNPWAEDAA